MSIPKIIHQIAPKDKSNWHPMWERCYLSWKKQFPEQEYTHILWDDHDDIDKLIKNSYPQYLHFYNNLPFHIMKIDFVRFCILYEYGGIYADMDMYCYENFYSDLKEDYYLIGSNCDFETIQNSLMVSTCGNKFLKYCIDGIVLRYVPFTFKINSTLIKSGKWYPYIRKTTGPKVLGEIFNDYGGTNKNILPWDIYNNDYLFYDSKLKTRHMLTGRWGKDVIESEKTYLNKNDDHLSYEEFSIECYKDFRKIDLNTFDFHFNYLN